MEKRDFKAGVYGGIAQMTKALSNSHRLEVLDLLAQGEKTVEAIAGEINASVANASQHLQVLRQARLVSTRRQGHFVFYSLANPSVFQAWQALRALSIRQLPDVERVVQEFRTGRNTLEEISIEELVGRLKAHEVLLLDVRPTEEYQAGHIPRAVSIPPGNWEERLQGLPQDKDVVAYCRGPFCVFADEAVSYLKSRGYRATRLEEGFPDWKLRGLPVAI
jgi:rhodanese-related sulfurtransferase